MASSGSPSMAIAFIAVAVAVIIVLIVAAIVRIVECIQKTTHRTSSHTEQISRTARQQLALLQLRQMYPKRIPPQTKAPIATSETQKASTPPPSNEHFAVAIPWNHPVSPYPQVQGATIDRFLNKMAREKPVQFTPQQLEGFTQGFSTELGSGGFGVVYKGKFPDGVQVAIKVLNNSEKRGEQQFMAEVGTIGRTYHINLVRLYGFCFDPAMRALVYEYMENGSLERFLFDENRAIEWGKLHEIAIGTAKGIAYLHEECQQRIIHYDIKPANVLLDENLNSKLADFGLAKLCNRESSHVVMTGCRGTPGYAAPELWTPFPVTHKCDVYSFGMLLFEIVGRRRNYDNNVSDTQEWLPRWTWKMFEKNELAEMLSLCGIEEKDREKAERMSMVALWCVQYLPGERPNMSTVVNMLAWKMEITPPPNPFEHLESLGPNGIASGSNENSDPSMSTARTSEQSANSEPSYSQPVRGPLQIELAG